MSSKRDNDFPAVSIGRTSGARLQQASAAHEAHPLLSPGRNSPTPSEQGSIGGPSSGNGATLVVNGGAKYVPYTPRQRVTATAATTGTTVHPSSPQHHQGDATSKLQLMHLKAAAQGLGVDSGCLGWSILEKLVVDVEISEEWTEVWNVITTGKATLLLPLESAFTHEKITPDFVKDHIILSDGPSRKGAQIVTLSGLRGTLDGQGLTFRSTINPTSKLFQDILNPTTRTSALSLLPPLPTPLPNISPITYPQFEVPSYAPSLHLPPRTPVSIKPPLPPRPSNRPAVPAVSTASSRISLPFASLFGGNHAKPSVPVPASPPTSVRSFDSSQDTNTPIEISAFSIDRRIIRKDIGKEINKRLKTELKTALAATSSLGNIPVPSWVSERVHDITADWYPFIKSSPLNRTVGAENGGKGYVVNPIEENPDDAAERLQDFYLSLEQDMRAGGTPFISRRKEKESETDAEDEKGREKREHDRMESETRIREVMEAVECTITSLFYDRLFMQTTTDDASHDEALSSRVAALNMLDLGLGHLGIEAGEAVNESELNAVVKACGDMLSQLNACHGPGDKSSILVAAHKIVVDGLSRLPPIRLISEDEVDEEPPTAKPSFSPEASEKGDPDGSSSLLLSPSNSGSEFPSGLDSKAVEQSSQADPAPAGDSLTPKPSKVKSPPPPLSLDPPPSTQPTRPQPSHLELSKPPKEPTPVSGDVLLPIIIFSVVKANPPHLVSNLLFTQRFRNQSVGGEESYCLINLLAVAEFLENVDMAGLGLGDSDKVMSTADLTPIPLTRSPVTSETPLEPIDALQAGLRNRVGQQVDAIADSANKVITGVVDSSFGILRSFMPSNAAHPHPPSAPGSATGRITPGTPTSMAQGLKGPGFGLLRRESGFSIASLAASLPITVRPRSNAGGGEEAGQQLVTVSRATSLKSRSSAKSLKVRIGDGDESDVDESDHGDESDTTNDEEESEAEVGEEDADTPETHGGGAAGGDARSIRSFENMLSASKQRPKSARSRKSLSDRLATVSALAGIKGSNSPSHSRRSSLLQPPQPPTARPTDTPASSRPVSPVQYQYQYSSSSLRLAPPKQRFIDCAPDDLRLSEVRELLRDYRRLVEGIRAVGGFED
ncbi:hypothetical protein M413DRAFT_447811 [Hebeloma cylindrosporum]|uniref:VPS9 domain-containing protein n=1 Tax=Hebeloma cylindrosporum TaxID=76867 RepID=A0A0C3C3Y9_HEBCY|nr:hypothetical protein M413DRAFT_447811 [Hebeloma cylindrosporum h7]